MQKGCSELSGEEYIVFEIQRRVEIYWFWFRYDSHPMAILTSAFAYLGSMYSEANPSLQGKLFWVVLVIKHGLWTYAVGQTLYTKGDAASLANMDKQIYRLIGKATTLAA